MNPIVIVVRDPDASNEYHVFDGEVETYDIDLGYSNLSDRDELGEWAFSHFVSATEFLQQGRIAPATFILQTVQSQLDRFNDGLDIPLEWDEVRDRYGS